LKETISDETLITYIDKLIQSFGLYPNVSETALRIQFDHHLYPECVLEVMRKMGIENSIKLRKYSEEKWPHKNAAAMIHMPVPLPTFASQEFKKLLLLIEIRQNATEHFHAFIASITHELSHVVLYGTKHELHKSEIATDLCLMVFGFSTYYMKGREVETIDILLGKVTLKRGYLDDRQSQLAYEYLQKLLAERFRNKETKPRNLWGKIRSLFKYFER
jgi:hypothetical protein